MPGAGQSNGKYLTELNKHRLLTEIFILPVCLGPRISHRPMPQLISYSFLIETESGRQPLSHCLQDVPEFGQTLRVLIRKPDRGRKPMGGKIRESGWCNYSSWDVCFWSRTVTLTTSPRCQLGSSTELRKLGPRTESEMYLRVQSLIPRKRHCFCWFVCFCVCVFCLISLCHDDSVE